ncbi:YhdB family protein [Jeotgalibacillus campisalis]|uniref:YhdB-like protein n=1 Tax=Jeotgalibacillus campisalis TaxID=220754 RepID=A0A0C2RYE7_9BACL|nr:YhdB family protein [Jeotgalibacillus campisalis]KIL46829.1 hypothetical protein KR50_25260 [Jeotgalibacillus campisalis]
MNNDYDRTLLYLYRHSWDDMLILMVRTKDDLLSKKIKSLLKGIHYPQPQETTAYHYTELFRYAEYCASRLRSPAVSVL